MKRTQIVVGAAVLALGILSVRPAVRAVQPFDGGENDNATGEPFRSARISCRFRQVRILVWVPLPNRLLQNLTRAS